MNLSWRQSKTYQRLAGPSLFNWRLFWWSYLILFIPQILFDVIAFGAPSLLWLPIWTSAHLAATAAVLVAKGLGFDRFQAKKPSALANLLLASVAGAIRVVWVGIISFNEGLAQEFNLPVRIASGVILGLLLFIALTNLLEINRQYSTALRALVKTRNQLSQLRKLSSKKFEQAQLELTIETRSVVEPRLSEIARLLRKQKLTSRLRNSITRDLRDILDNQVKPLNKNLRTLSKGFESPELTRNARRSTLFRIPSGVQADLAISEFWIFMLLLGVTPFSLYIFENEQWAPLGLAVSVLNYVMVLMARKVLQKQGLVSLTQAIAQYLLLSLQLVLTNHFLLLLAGYPEASAPFVVLMTFITLVFTIFAVGIEAVQEHNRSDFLREMSRNNATIERRLSLLNQRAWVEKRRWALMVHGTVQGSLSAALARLKNGEALNQTELNRIAKHVIQAKKGLAGPVEKNFDFKKAISQQIKSWAGIMKITVDRKSPQFEELTLDEWAGYCANEIIKEALSNAFRHGEAKSASVSFQSQNPGFVTIEITNDGKPLSSKQRDGLGSQLLDEIANPWSLSKVPDGVRLSARIPVSSLKSTVKSV